MRELALSMGLMSGKSLLKKQHPEFAKVAISVGTQTYVMGILDSSSQIYAQSCQTAPYSVLRLSESSEPARICHSLLLRNVLYCRVSEQGGHVKYVLGAHV